MCDIDNSGTLNDNCDECSDQTTCTKCAVTFGLDLSDNSCAACDVADCDTCSSDKTKC